VIAFFLIRETGLRPLPAGLLAFAAASLTTVLGAVMAAVSLHMTQLEPPIGWMLGAAAGALLYVMLFHFGPHAALTPPRSGYLFASLGVVITITAITIEHL